MSEELHRKLRHAHSEIVKLKAENEQPPNRPPKPSPGGGVLNTEQAPEGPAPELAYTL